MDEKVQELDLALLDLALLRLKKWQKRRQFLLLLCSVVVVFLAGVLLFRDMLGLCLANGASMAPSLYPGDVLLFVRRDTLEYGDMILLESEDGGLIVKRVVGLSGDTIEVSLDGHLTRNGSLVEESNVIYGEQNAAQWITFPCDIGPDEVFYLGDNRPVSLDSRIIGPVSIEQIVGVVMFSLRLSP